MNRCFSYWINLVVILLGYQVVSPVGASGQDSSQTPPPQGKQLDVAIKRPEVDGTIVEDFENKFNWGQGGNSARATSVVRTTVKFVDGTFSMEMRGEFGIPGQYKYVRAYLVNPIIVEGKIKKFGVWMFGDNSQNKITLSFIDDVGNLWIISAGIIDFNGWKWLDFPFADAYAWGGNKIKSDIPKLPLKIRDINIVCPTKDSMGAFIAYLDNLAVFGEDIKVNLGKRKKLTIPDIRPVNVKLRSPRQGWNKREYGKVIAKLDIDADVKQTANFELTQKQDILLCVTLKDADGNGTLLGAVINGHTLLPSFQIGFDGEATTPTPALEALFLIDADWTIAGENALVIRNLGPGFCLLDTVALHEIAEPVVLPPNPIMPRLGFNTDATLRVWTEDMEDMWLATGCLPGGVVRADFQWMNAQLDPDKWTEDGYFGRYVKGLEYWHNRGLLISTLFGNYPWYQPEFARDNNEHGHPNPQAYEKMLSVVAKRTGQYVDHYLFSGEMILVEDYASVDSRELQSGLYYTPSDFLSLMKRTGEILRKYDTVDADGDGQPVRIIAAVHASHIGKPRKNWADLLAYLASKPSLAIQFANADGIAYNVYDPEKFFYDPIKTRKVVREMAKRHEANPDMPLWITELGRRGQWNGKITGKDWEYQEEYYRAIPDALQQIKGLVDTITFFTLNSDSWGVVVWGQLFGKQGREYAQLTPSGNKFIRPLAIAYTLSGQMVPAELDTDTPPGLIVKAVRLGKTEDVVVGATNRGGDLVKTKVLIPGCCDHIDYFEPLGGKVTKKIKSDMRDGSIILPVTLKPGQSVQYILREFRTASAENVIVPRWN